MTTPITDNWIAEQEAICAKATEGPWTGQGESGVEPIEFNNTFDTDFNVYPPLGHAGPVAVFSSPEDALFGIHARTALPLALAELRRLREVLSRLYPGMMGSGMCSKHPSADAVLSCSICFPNWNDLCSAHCELKQLAWDRLRELGEPIPGIDTALAARERGE